MLMIFLKIDDDDDDYDDAKMIKITRGLVDNGIWRAAYGKHKGVAASHLFDDDHDILIIIIVCINDGDHDI